MSNAASGPPPLGATPEDGGTTFAVWSSGEAVDLCLYDDAGRESRVPLTHRTHGVWHAHVPGVGDGQRYGYRVHGPWDPWHGHRFNPAKLLVDPYARAIDGELQPDDSVLDHSPFDDTVLDGHDSAAFVPRSVVVDARLDWGGDRKPDVPWSDTVVYELHVRGFTMRHPDVPEALRGTYAGLAHPAVLEHLTSLGVTTVELLPVHQYAPELSLTRRGLANFWGYNTLGFFAPHAGYSSAGSRGGQVREFAAMVRAMHAAGLEVVLDVVYNHTAEGGVDGPTLSLRGLDNHSLLPPASRPPLRGLHRLRQHSRPPAAADAGAGHRLVALLGAGDARRRIPFRPRPGTRPGIGRVRGERDVPVGDRSGPGAVAGQADRRAVGCRSWWLSARPLPRPVGGVERPLPRHGAGVMARHQRSQERCRQAGQRHARPRLSRDGILGRLRRRRSGTHVVGQLRHSARRVHPARPGDLRAEAQRAQR